MPSRNVPCNIISDTMASYTCRGRHYCTCTVSYYWLAYLVAGLLPIRQSYTPSMLGFSRRHILAWSPPLTRCRSLSAMASPALLLSSPIFCLRSLLKVWPRGQMLRMPAKIPIEIHWRGSTLLDPGVTDSSPRQTFYNVGINNLPRLI